MSTDTALVAMESMEVATVLEQGSLATILTSEIRQQLAAAHEYPRNIERFKTHTLSLATIDQEVAKTMFFSIKRGSKRIEGGSIFLAEICLQNWGNVRLASRLIDVQEKTVVAQGVCHDLETNSAVCAEVHRRITNSDGKRYNDDMIAVTSNACCSIAARNAVFRMLPRSYVRGFWQSAKAMAIGTTSELPQRRLAMVEHFKEIGVTIDQILIAIGKPEIDQISLGDLGDLIGMSQAIEQGISRVEDVFPSGEPQAKGTTLVEPKPTKTKRKKSKKSKKIETSAKVEPSAEAEPPENEPSDSDDANANDHSLAGDEEPGTDAGSPSPDESERKEVEAVQDADDDQWSHTPANPVKLTITAVCRQIDRCKAFDVLKALSDKIADENLYNAGENKTIEARFKKRLGELAGEGDEEAKLALEKYSEWDVEPRGGSES